MIDFACKQFDLEDIIKCGLSLTRKEFQILKYFMICGKQDLTTQQVAKKLNLNLTTIQKATKKLYEKEILVRHQKNLGKGGYVYVYEISSKKKIRNVLKEIIRTWSEKVEKEIDKW